MADKIWTMNDISSKLIDEIKLEYGVPSSNLTTPMTTDYLYCPSVNSYYLFCSNVQGTPRFETYIPSGNTSYLFKRTDLPGKDCLVSFNMYIKANGSQCGEVREERGLISSVSLSVSTSPKPAEEPPVVKPAQWKLATIPDVYTTYAMNQFSMYANTYTGYYLTFYDKDEKEVGKCKNNKRTIYPSSGTDYEFYCETSWSDAPNFYHSPSDKTTKVYKLDIATKADDLIFDAEPVYYSLEGLYGSTMECEFFDWGINTKTTYLSDNWTIKSTGQAKKLKIPADKIIKVS